MTYDSTSWHAYGKIYAIGHRATSKIFIGPVTIEEKVDGSQFSFGKFDGKVKVRSRGRVFDVEAPDDLFASACETVERLSGKLVDGWTYRGEVLKSPRHNVLCYDRAPEGNIILFDIATGHEDYMPWESKQRHAMDIGLEVVPKLFEGTITQADQHILDEIKGTTSILGGTAIEGFVVKNYDQFTVDGKVLMGKWVSERFKEVHRKNYKPQQESKQDISLHLAGKYTTEARWTKAVQHAREDGTLERDPRDIGPLIRSIQSDLKGECEEEIKQDLFDAYWKKLAQNVTRGFAEWYKDTLLESVFEED